MPPDGPGARRQWEDRKRGERRGNEEESGRWKTGRGEREGENEEEIRRESVIRGIDIVSFSLSLFPFSFFFLPSFILFN